MAKTLAEGRQPGSGRRADPVKRLIGFSQPAPTDTAEIYLPNLSGVRKEARKDSLTSPTGGSAGHVIQDEGTPLTARANLNFSGASVTAIDDLPNDATVVSIAAAGEVDPIFTALSGAYWVANSGAFLTAETDPVFVALSGGLPYVTAEVDPVFVALSGGLAYVTAEVDPIFASLSGAYWVANSGAFVTTEADPVFVALSGGLPYLPTTLSGAYWIANSGAFVVTEADPVFVALSGGLPFLPTTLSGAYFINNSGAFALETMYQDTSGAYATHAADSSDPHGATLTQTKLTSSGEISGAALFNTGDHNTSGAAMCLGIITSDAATPPSASAFPQGTIYVQYTA